MTIRNWDGAIRATPRTPRSCDGPRGSVSMRPLGLAGQRSLQARRALVSLASIVEWPVNNRCVSAPHDDMRRRRRESHGWRGLARSGRVVGPREGDGSLIDSRLVTLASINLGGSCHCKWASVRVSWRTASSLNRNSRTPPSAEVQPQGEFGGGLPPVRTKQLN